MAADGAIGYVAAARHAIRNDDPPLAERLARAALDTNARDAPDALAVLADALEKQGRHREVVELLSRPGSDEVDPAGLAVVRASNLYWGLQDPTGARASLQRAQAADGPDARRREVQATEAWILLFDSRLPDCIDMAHAVFAHPDASHQALVWAATAGTAALGLAGRTEEALMLADKGQAAADALGAAQPWGHPEVSWARVIALAVGGHLADARALVDAGRAQVTADASAQLVGMWAGFHGLVARFQGDLATAVASLRQAVALLEDGDMYGYTQLWLAELAGAAALTGDVDEARAALADAGARASDVNRVFRPWVGLAAAWTHASEGRMHEAAIAALAAADTAHALGQRAVEAGAAFDAARLGRPAQVRDRLRTLAGTLDFPLAWLYADATDALAEGAAPALLTAADRFRRLGARLIAAELAAAAHAHLRAAGSLGPAAIAAERSRQLRHATPDASTPLLRIAPRHLVLTLREREIATAAAAGRTSREIAEALAISTRTVDNHLGRVYAKLAIHGRTALAEIFGFSPAGDI